MARSRLPPTGHVAAAATRRVGAWAGRPAALAGAEATKSSQRRRLSSRVEDLEDVSITKGVGTFESMAPHAKFAGAANRFSARLTQRTVADDAAALGPQAQSELRQCFEQMSWTDVGLEEGLAKAQVRDLIEERAPHAGPGPRE